MTSKGYARLARISSSITDAVFTGALWTLAGGTTIPAAVDVPLHKSPPSLQSTFIEKGALEEGTDGFPVIVFSHGMASSRTQYSTYCGELASRGYVVAAIEHRDGSSPGSTIMKKDGSESVKYSFGLRDLKFVINDNNYMFNTNIFRHNADFDIAALKSAQTDFRHAEIVETVRVLQAINNGAGADILKANPRKEGSDFPTWTGRLAMHNITIAGHSYGATGVVR